MRKKKEDMLKKEDTNSTPAVKKPRQTRKKPTPKKVIEKVTEKEVEVDYKSLYEELSSKFRNLKDRADAEKGIYASSFEIVKKVSEEQLNKLIKQENLLLEIKNAFNEFLEEWKSKKNIFMKLWSALKFIKTITVWFETILSKLKK